MNILTFDVEEWFHLLDNDSTRSEAQWLHYEKRIDGNVGRIFDILDSTETKATFFIIGWIAKKYPELVRRISEKYQIGSHTMNHQLVWQQTPAEFKKDVEESVKRLEDICGKKVTCFRAPGFSIRETEAWAFEILAELGIEYDCSVFPARHAHGGMATYPKNGPCIVSYKGIDIKEFPITFKKILNRNIIFSEGGYFRLFPYSLIRKWAAETDYVMCGIHPRDMDPAQPMIKELSALRKFKSYYGLSNSERKLRQWLSECEFTDIESADKAINWSLEPKFELK